jgi:hypothetical protein
MAKKKKPRPGYAPRAGKQPESAIDPDKVAEKESVSWRLSILDWDGCEWSWCNVDQSTIEDIHKKLCGHETMTLSEFYNKPGTNKIALLKLSKEARQRATKLKLDATLDVWEIRLSSAGRVWGTMTGSVFNLLWWDPQHTVYKVPKKNT